MNTIIIMEFCDNLITFPGTIKYNEIIVKLNYEIM